MLHGYAKIAGAGVDVPTLTGAHIETLFSFISNEAELTNHFLHNCFSALLILNREDRIMGTIDSSWLENLVKKNVPSLEFDRENMHIIFHAISTLAEHRHLSGDFEPTILQQPLMRHEPQLIGSKTISTHLGCLSWLSKRQKFKGDINTPALFSLFNGLIHFKPENMDGRDISTSIYSMGILMKGGLIAGFIDALVLQELLKNLHEIVKKNIKTQKERKGLLLQETNNIQMLRKSFHGIGNMAEASGTRRTLKASLLQELLMEMESYENLQEAEIRHVLRGLGMMAKGGLIGGFVNPSNLFRKLSSFRRLLPKSLGYSFHGIASMAEAGVLTGNIEEAELKALLDQLKLKPLDRLKPRNISYLLGDFASLIKARMIGKDAIDTGTLQWLFEAMEVLDKNKLFTLRDIKDSLSGFIRLKPYLKNNFSDEAIVKVKNWILTIVKQLKTAPDPTINNIVTELRESGDRDIETFFIEAWEAIYKEQITPTFDSFENQNNTSQSRDSRCIAEKLRRDLKQSPKDFQGTKGQESSFPEINNPYGASDIHAVWTARIKGYAKTSIRVTDSNSLAKVINDFINSDEAKNTERLLIPIQHEKQWVGLLVILQNIKIKQMLYFNSYINKSDDCIKKIETELSQNKSIVDRLIAPGLKIDNAPTVMAYNDAASTAILVIENFYCHLKFCQLQTGWWPPITERKVSPYLKRLEISLHNVEAMKKRHLERYHEEHLKKTESTQSQNGFFAPANEQLRRLLILLNLLLKKKSRREQWNSVNKSHE